MKKVALLIALMTIIAFTAFAGDIAVTVTGSSELTFGVNFNEPVAAGFTNANASCVSFTLVSGDSTKGAEEAVYGMIEVKGWGVTYKSDDGGWAGVDEGDVTAKIIFPNGWVKISGTNASLNFINIVQNDGGVKDTDDKGVNDALANSGGFVVGLNFAPISVELGVFSENDWKQDAAGTAAVDEVWGWVDDDDDQTTEPVWDVATEAVPAGAATDDLNDEMGFGMNLKVTADFTVVKVEAGLEVGLNHSDTGIGAGGKVTGTFGPLSVYAGADLTYDVVEVLTVEVTGVMMDIGFGAALNVAGIKVNVDASVDSLSASAAGTTVKSKGNLMDVRAKIDASAMVPNLGLTLTVELFNLGDAAETATLVDEDTDGDLDAEYAIILDASYDAGKVKPFASLTYATYSATDNVYTYTAANEEVIKLKIGADIKVITNVVFTAVYESTDLSGAVTDAGTFKVITKISL